jgi:uncharacterized protein (UPF0276 family)
MDLQRCSVGLFYNPAMPQFLRTHLSAVDHVEVAPDMFWTDHGPEAPQRFELLEPWVDELDWLAPRCPLVAHGVGYAVGLARTPDEQYFEHLSGWLGRYPFRWHSSHLSGAPAECPAPLPLDHEVLDLVANRARGIRERIDLPFLLENPVYYVRLVEQELEETQFLNELVARDACALLLDLHNLYANSRNFRFNPFEYLGQLRLDAVTELHIAGGSEFAGMYTDSHAGACHPIVWELLDHTLPRTPNLRAVTFEFHESYFPLLGEEGVLRELARAREIVARHKGAGPG